MQPRGKTIWMVMVVALWATSIAQAERLDDPPLPSSAQITKLVAQRSVTVSAEVPADTGSSTHIPEPTGLLLAGLAACGLTAIHLRRRWG